MTKLLLTRLLKVGSLGDDVEKIQDRLEELGYAIGDSKRCGVFNHAMSTMIAKFQNQHLGPHGKFLRGDGVVGEKTIWALNYPSGKAQRSELTPLYPDDLPPLRNKLLAQCLLVHKANVHEIPAGSNWGDGIPQFGGKEGWSWCCLSATTVARRAGVEVPHLARVYDLWKWAEKRGMFYPIDSIDPLAHLPGNFLIWQHKTSRGAWTKTGHISIEAMIKVWTDGRLRECNTFGGNEGHRWKYGHRLGWVKKGGEYAYVESDDLIGTINPFPKDSSENKYRLKPTDIQRVERGMNEPTR